ncbi:chaperonin 10-like protein [Parachaetomium inaequale]|uniref:Chaperonin 10-like protein n=1 Tax=Parachaetomium inaequale TaxID=2588326 RepID=A0AAN6SS30_9PEZI|nr:chaperonin 10-like protein [Parachaetomium inaequale]
MALPSEIKAVVITKPDTAEVKTVSLPTLPDDYILVRPTAVALNPTDWKHIAMGESTVGTRVGCDYAGIVEQVGPKVTKPFAKGDRICGMVHGADKGRPEGGAFGEYIIVKGDVQIKTPDNLSDEEAATLGVGISTVAQGLYQALQLPLPGTTTTSNPPPEILIYGGSTATGILGIQFAKLSGYRVVTTCSPANFSYVRSLGADAAFNYHSPTVADDIRAWSKDPDALTLAWDCVGAGDSPVICAAALSRTRAGHYRSVMFFDDEVLRAVNDKVDNGFRLAYTIFGEAFDKTWGAMPAIPEDYEYGKMFWELARDLLAQGKVKPARGDVNRGGEGLDGVLVGLSDLKEGKVSGVKLVYTI